MVEKELKCPIEKDRLQVLLYNTITYLNTEMILSLELSKKIDILKNELGFTDDEIEQLKIKENCL